MWRYQCISIFKEVPAVHLFPLDYLPYYANLPTDKIIISRQKTMKSFSVSCVNYKHKYPQELWPEIIAT